VGDAGGTGEDIRVPGGSAEVDAYMARLPLSPRVEVEAVRRSIRAVVPDATESISYGIPTFSVGGRYLVYLAAWKRHLSLYPVPRGGDALRQELAPYRSGQGTLKFAYGTPIPEGLVERILTALLEEHDRTRLDDPPAHKT
jgi:uncharacterized protein YdhG (YjbR/CyaY superfamily)